MREILFRGKMIDQDEWVKGSLVIHGKSVLIFSTRDVPYGSGMFHVDPETVGQFTGLTDKNGKQIFEGDILEFEDCGETGYEYKEGFYFTNRAVVAWRHSAWEFGKFMYHDSCVLEEMYSSREDFIEIFNYSEIIGNIQDNPELLKGE